MVRGKIESFTTKSKAVSHTSRTSQASQISGELHSNPPVNFVDNLVSNSPDKFGENPANDLVNNSPEATKIENIETIAVLETQIDDLSPQAISYACDRLLQVGALDVFTQGITMKKSRLGTLLTVIAPVAKIAECEQVLFQETSTLGIRRSMQTRSILHREIQPVTTEHGLVRVKVAWQQSGQILNVQPEYEDCAAIARSTNLPLREIQATTLKHWSDQEP
ncbi:MAG: LarC family nickel insertion protein [Coleofasciculaceae cyanobacterium SM2_1_6]|nr:LarC family nickel insertion protein [Coleofasciculaceae cyanobacterium SM2_1_6]